MACVLARGGDGGSSIPGMCANLTNSRSGTAGCASSWSLADVGAINPRVPNRFFVNIFRGALLSATNARHGDVVRGDTILRLNRAVPDPRRGVARSISFCGIQLVAATQLAFLSLYEFPAAMGVQILPPSAVLHK